MALRIIVNNIELPIVPNTLRIKKENSVFTDKFTVSASTKPFLVINSEQSRKALGIASLYSISPKAFESATFIDNEEPYSAHVLVLGSVKGAIKCSVTYAPFGFEYFSVKIYEFFDIISVIGGDFTGYKEEVKNDYNDKAYKGFVENYVSRSFPEVDFNFPTLPYSSRQGRSGSNDDWFQYKGEINSKKNGVVLLNSNFNGSLINQNIVIPYFYLLSPLFKVFKEFLGYNISGSFIENKAIRKTLMFHDKDNLTAVDLGDKRLYRQWRNIDADRFIPEWTVSEYLNYIKNMYNLKIDIINSTKEIKVNFVEDIYFNSEILDISEYSTINELFPKYFNKTHYRLQSNERYDLMTVGFDDINVLEKEGNSVVKLNTAFKAVPKKITKNWESIKGVGLMFYDFSTDSTYHLTEYDNTVNTLYPKNGIGGRYWRKWLRMRLKEKEVPLQLKCTNKQKHDLESANKVYIFNQEFLIKTMEFEERSGKYLIKLVLLSFNP